MTEKETNRLRNPKLNIIGGGLAGTTLAWSCFLKGIPFQLQDLPKPKASSKAAGLFNPIVFRKLTLSWQAHKLISSCFSFYPAVEKKIGVNFFFPKPLKKLMSTIEEVNTWEAKRGSESHAPFLGKVEAHENFYLGHTHQAGFLDLPTYLKTSHACFKNLGFFATEEKASRISIHCKGSYEKEHGIFSYLPFSLTKGETLTLKIPTLKISYILKKHYFLLPLGNDLYRFGATYNWDDPNWQPSQEGKEVLIERLEEMVDQPYEILDHQAGVRPTTRDRRPFLGEHPTQKGNFIFNGLGSKGVMIAPFYANHLISHIFEGKELDNEVAITRYQNYFTT